MTMSTSAILTQVFGEVVERQAFMFVGAVDEVTEPPEAALLGEIHFTGQHSGKLCLGLPAAMSAELAANILGLEPDDASAEEAGLDAVRELLNVTCGHVLTTLAGEGPVFDLGVPELRPLDAAGWQELAARPGAAAMVVDGHPVILHFDGPEFGS